MKTHRPRFTLLPFLQAMFLAVFAMPTNVVQVCYGEMGIEHTQPWRATFSGLVSRGRQVLSRLRAICTSWLASPFALPAAVAVAALLLVAAGQVDLHAQLTGQPEVLSGIGVAGVTLQGARQAVADVDQRLATNAQRVAEVDRDISAIADAVTAEKRSMKDEEKAKLADLRGQKTSLGEIKATLLEQKASASQDLVTAEAANERERTAPAVPDPDAKAGAKATVVLAGALGSDEDPKRGFKSHKEFMAVVMAAGRTNRIDARLKPLQVVGTAGSDEHGTYSDPSAAFLLPVAFSPDLLAVRSEGDPTAVMTRKLPMDAPMVKINARIDKDHSSSVSGGLRVYRHSETAAATASRAQTEQLTFTAEDLMGLAYATENQIADSPSSFIAFVADGFKDEFDRKVLREKLRGVGAAGEYTGVMNAPALITVAKETGQAPDTIVKENIDKMESRLWAPDASDRVCYMANKTALPQLSSLVQTIGVGGVQVPYLTMDASGQRRLNGRLIFFTEVCRAIGDLGDIVLVNWAEFIEGTYQPMQQAESIHVRFANNERAYKFWVRNCGKSWWSSVLTPENGQTMSPMVTLAAR